MIQCWGIYWNQYQIMLLVRNNIHTKVLYVIIHHYLYITIAYVRELLTSIPETVYDLILDIQSDAHYT